MAQDHDSTRESVVPGDDPQREDLPGELLGEDLVDPGAYQLDPAETEAEELTDADAPVEPETDVTDEAQLVAAESVAQRARSSRPVRRSAAPAPAPTKGAATRTRSARAVADRPTGPVQFARESVDELKKVVWPTWPTVQQFFWAVLVFVLIVIAYVGLLDLGFGWLLLKLLG